MVGTPGVHRQAVHIPGLILVVAVMCILLSSTILAGIPGRLLPLAAPAAVEVEAY